MPSRLILALALSLILHAAVLFGDAVRFAPPPAQPPLEASLRQPAKTPPRAEDPLLKDTLIADPPAVKPPPATRPAPPAGPPLSQAAAKRQVDAARRKLSQHVYYPPDAVARGLEGEVRLLLRVSDDGHISDVSIAASSGHAILDQAAIKAAYAMGKVNWVQSRELILPVVFRLE
jgi:protein TonB